MKRTPRSPKKPRSAPAPPVTPAQDGGGRFERWAVALCCLLGAVRVFVFSAAFPLFSNVDEQAHFDLIYKYSRGHVPRSIERIGDNAIILRALYGSPEYLRTEDIPPIPAWQFYTGEQETKFLRESVRHFRDLWKSTNHQATQPPCYYAAAAAWFRLGELLHLPDVHLLYWTRFFNVPVYALLVWLAYLLTREIFPRSAFLRLGVPLVLAFFPQDVFYSWNNDVLSAPLVTLALYCLLRMVRDDSPRFRLALGAGLSAAAAFLTKGTNAPILLMVGLVAAWQLRPSRWGGRPAAHLAPVALLIAAACIPVGCWLLRNYFVLGAWTDVASKGRYLGWTPKPVSEYWNHPIFTPGGVWFFWKSLMSTFWRGELCWHREIIAIPWVDLVYVASSSLFLATFAVCDIGLRAKQPEESARLAAIGFCFFFLFVAALIRMSVAFDFGPCFSPSRKEPYFMAGRLILGGLVPFWIMYVRAIDALFGWRRCKYLRWLALAFLVELMIVPEIIVTLDMFASRYNWYWSL
jgi:hypothetical protein